MNRDESTSPFFIFTCVVILTATVLIWWGAGVTTMGFGMAVPDWPYSYGSINPPGWINNDPLVWEHGHRLVASLVGFMTLAMFGWRFVRGWKQGVELLGLVVLLAAIMVFLVKDNNALATIGGLACVAWLVWSWTSRGWPLLTKLTALALIIVSLQAFLGGIRVLQISNNFAVVHGCLAQGFYCLLILIAMLAWPKARPLKVPDEQWTKLRRFSVILFVMIVFQLIFGATMRHHHRYGMAAPGVIMTGDSWFPGFGNLTLLVLFLHKWWAVCVLALAGYLATWSFRPLAVQPLLRNLILVITGLMLLQMTLGISVIVTGKSFWVTNIHVINGLGILAATFVLMVHCLRSQPASILLADGKGKATMDAKAA